MSQTNELNKPAPTRSILRSLRLCTLWIAGIAITLITALKIFSFYITYPYYQVEMGMSEKQVVKIFGESRPLIDRSTKPSICEISDSFKDCRALQAHKATVFLTFKIFFDTYGVIGFKDNKVIFKEIGDA